MRFADGSELEVDFIVFSTGIRQPTRQAGHPVRSGGCPARRIMVNDTCQTSDPDIYAIGECASWNNRVFFMAPATKWRRSPLTISSKRKRLRRRGLERQAEAAGRGRGRHRRCAWPRRARAATFISTRAKRSHKRLIVSQDNKTTYSVGAGGRHQRLRQPATGAERHRTAGESGRAILPAHAAASRLSASINCRTARRSAPASTSPKAC